MSNIELKFMQQIGDGLDAAVNARHLPNPAMASDNPNETDSAAYIRALRARLIELGYLGEGDKLTNRSKVKFDPLLSEKIKRFQKDAGIKGDGWAGGVTWNVLECLVSFENQQNPAKWHRIWQMPDDLLSNSAVMRAVYCRLYAMGFFADWDRDHINTKTLVAPADNPAFQDAIQKFCSFARLLGLVKPTCKGLSIELLTAIFEYDKVVAMLSRDDVFSKVNIAFQQNVEAIARIELWLLGYDVMPGKDQIDWQTVRRGKNLSRIKKSKTQLSIERFYADHQLAKAEVMPVTNVTAELMAAFSQLSVDMGKDEQDDQSLNASVDRILMDEEGREVFQNQFQQLANGVFDGIKRVVRWLFNMIKRVVKFSTEFIANIVRYISKKARKYFVGVVKAFDIVYSGMSYLKNTTYHYSMPTKLYFGHDRDFDQYCLIDPEAGLQLINTDSSHYNLRSTLYAAGLNIVAHLLRMAHKVIRAVTSPAGWLLALLALSSLANSIEEIESQVKLVEQHELDIEHQHALFKTRIS